MLSNQWYAVLQAKTLKKKPIGVRRFGKDLVLWRTPNGKINCALDICPHRGAALSRGRIKDGCLECPYHGIRFGSDGDCAHVPFEPDATIPTGFGLMTLPVRHARGLIWVFHGAEAPPPLPWSDAFEEELVAEGGAFSEICDTFDVSYMRVMENLTDYHHVAHVHRTTVNVSPVMTAFEAHREGLEVWVEGTLGEPGERGSITSRTHIVAPFLAILDFEGLARFATAVCPIDEDRVWLFARYTQSLVNLPFGGIDRLLGWLLATFDYRLLQRVQDYPVWRSQRLTDPGDIGRYHLFHADEGVRLYFEIHKELAA